MARLAAVEDPVGGESLVAGRVVAEAAAEEDHYTAAAWQVVDSF
jgi:hypothetical protein